MTRRPSGLSGLPSGHWATGTRTSLPTDAAGKGSRCGVCVGPGRPRGRADCGPLPTPAEAPGPTPTPQRDPLPAASVGRLVLVPVAQCPEGSPESPLGLRVIEGFVDVRRH